MLTEADIRSVLDSVIHPSFGMSLTALGMVRAVRVSAERIEVDLVMNCPGCPAAEAALVAARRALEAVGGRTIHLCLLPEVWRPPWSGPPEAEWHLL